MRLLISVVSPEEAVAALAGGADIIDVKNPAEGALGAPEPAVLRAVRRVVPYHVPLSVALGDAPHKPGTLALAAAGAASCGADYVKVGLLGSRLAGEALELVTAVRRAAEEMNPGVRVVAVAYADSARAGSLPPGDLPAVGAAAGVEGILLDTFVKDGASTFDALEERAIVALIAAAHAAGLSAGLAGSLRLEHIARAAELGADVIGVRGSACDGGRRGRVSAPRVRAFRESIERRLPPTSPSPAARSALPVSR